MLEAVDLSKAYGDHLALNKLNLRIEPGEIYCMLGANGAGKTTTVNLFLGFLKPTSGQARVHDMNVADHPRETKRYIAYIPEQVMLYPHLSGLENLEYFAALAHEGCPDRGRLESALTEAGLPREAMERRVATYSKGMRQKVGIALAIVKSAEVLLLDEPTSGLDPKAAREFSEILRTMSGRGTSILMVTHDIFHAKDTGTKIGIMRQGQLVEQVATAAIGYSDLERLYLNHMAA